MKSVIIIDAPPLFQEFLKGKLTDENVSVTVAQGQRDAFIKILSILPDLIIIDLVDDFSVFVEFLEKKYKDPNASKIPIIVSGPVIDRARIALLVKFGVVKYFTKPIKFDLFFESVGQILRLSFPMDVTPCMLDIHRNGDLIFIEVAQNLNREKLSLLKYRLAEIIDKEKLSSPKLVLMLTNLDLTFMDTVNIEMLIDNIIANPAVRKKNIKILSFSDFVRDLIDGHPAYTGIDVVESLPQVLNSVVESNASIDVSDLITDKVLLNLHEDDKGTIETRFHSDTGVKQDSNGKQNIKIAIVDDDAVILSLLKNAFTSKGILCDSYSSGAEFLSGVKKTDYSLTILDIFMPGISGLDILRRLQNDANTMPVIIYSQATKREPVMQALSLGAKTFIAKPQKPEDVVQKVLEFLNGNG